MNYKKASKIKLRIPTTKGMLTTEQLWDLSMKDLEVAVRSTKKVLKTENDDDDLSFLEETNKTDEISVLRFEILKDVYITKKEEREEKLRSRERKEEREKVLRVLEQRKDEKLNNLSEEELEKLYSDLK